MPLSPLLPLQFQLRVVQLLQPAVIPAVRMCFDSRIGGWSTSNVQDRISTEKCVGKLSIETMPATPAPAMASLLCSQYSSISPPQPGSCAHVHRQAFSLVAWSASEPAQAVAAVVPCQTRADLSGPLRLISPAAAAEDRQ